MHTVEMLERLKELAEEAGYDAGTIGRVKDLVMKKGLKTDPEAQLLEDVVCLVFLAHYFEEFARKHDEEKLVSILRKTWRKMSERGRETALGLDLPGTLRELVEKAADPRRQLRGKGSAGDLDPEESGFD